MRAFVCGDNRQVRGVSGEDLPADLGVVWFRFELYRERSDRALDEVLLRKWAPSTNGTEIPPTYATLDAGLLSPRPATVLLMSVRSDSSWCDGLSLTIEYLTPANTLHCQEMLPISAFKIEGQQSGKMGITDRRAVRFTGIHPPFPADNSARSFLRTPHRSSCVVSS